MAMTLEEYTAKRTGRLDVQARHMERMLAEVRAYRLREPRESDDDEPARRGGEAGDQPEARR